jgi:eukaryotic-like serine/threonine-protein kinase
MKSSIRIHLLSGNCIDIFTYQIPILIIFTLLIIISSGCTTSNKTSSTLTINLPSEKQLTIRTTPTLALSPDGKFVIYPADTINSDTRKLYLQPTNGRTGKILQDTTGGETPFFSPDGKWIGFFANGKLKKISIEGGNAQIISDVRTPAGGAWGNNDTIVFADGPVWQVSVAGGTPRQISQLNPGEQHSWPILLPNGKLLFNIIPVDRTVPTIVMQQMGSNNRTTLLEEGNYPRYADSSHLFYNVNGVLKAVPLDINRSQLSGTSLTVVDGALLSVSSGAAQYSVSQSGALVYVPGRIFGQSRRVVLLDRQGNERDAGLPLRRYSYVTFSADGKFMAIEADEQILIVDRQNKITLGVIDNATFPAWGPGATITFSSIKNGVPGLYRVAINNLNDVETLITGEFQLDHSYSWSSDGRQFAYTEIRPDSGMDIWLRKDNSSPEPLLNSSVHECCAVFSPDGQLMAYIAGESGQPEVYLMSLSSPETKIKLTDKGGREPVWSHGGKELFYWQDRQLMVVEITTEPDIRFSAPRPLFQGIFVSSTSTWRSRYDISPEDDEFVIIRRGAEKMGVTELNFIPNWMDRVGK